MDDTDSSYDQEKIQAQLGFSRRWKQEGVFSLQRNHNIFYSVTVLSLICDLISYILQSPPFCSVVSKP